MMLDKTFPGGVYWRDCAMKKLGESRSIAPLLALAFAGNWIAPVGVAHAQDDNPYAYCLSTCESLTGDARQACRAECFGPTNPGAGEGDGTPPEGTGPNPYPPSPPQPWPPGGDGDERPH